MHDIAQHDIGRAVSFVVLFGHTPVLCKNG